MEQKNIRWILVIIALVLFLNAKDTLPKEAVADIEGKYCIEDKDCPCFGTYVLGSTNQTARGIGTGNCESHKCSMTYCLDIAPVGNWLKDNPWQWAKSNPVMFLAIIGLLLMAALWPKIS